MDHQAGAVSRMVGCQCCSSNVRALAQCNSWCGKNQYVDISFATSNYDNLILILIKLLLVVLASSVVDECKSRTEFKTGYFYCHHEDQAANNSVAILKGLVDQLLDQYPDLLPPCHRKQTSSGEPILRTFQLALNILEYFCATVPKLFLVIDGIDECEQNDRKMLLDNLIKIVSEADNDEPGRLRLLVVSQEFPDIRKALNSSSVDRVRPNIVSLSEADNKTDIKFYIRKWVDKIAEQHSPFDEELKQYLRKLTFAKAKGTYKYQNLYPYLPHRRRYVPVR